MKAKHGAVDLVAAGFCLAVVVVAVITTILGSCAPLPLPGNPRCFACEGCANGTAFEDPKCCVGPCAPHQHDDSATLECVQRRRGELGLKAAREACAREEVHLEP